MLDLSQLEDAIWSIADGRSSDDDVALFHSEPGVSLRVLDRLIGEMEDDLDSVRRLSGDERDQVVTDISDTLDSLWATARRLRPELPEELSTTKAARQQVAAPATPAAAPEPPPEPVQLQASWSNGLVVVWASGRGATPESFDELSNRLEAVGGPPHGWQVHQSVHLPNGVRADALAIPMRAALGWLVAVGGGEAVGGRESGDGVGPSVRWLAQVAIEGVRLAASGAIVPSLKMPAHADNRLVETNLRWRPALADSPRVVALANAMPRTVTAITNADNRATTSAVIGSVIEAIVAEAVERMDLPEPPETVTTAAEFGEAFEARLDGSSFQAPASIAAQVSRTLDQWTRTVTSASRPKLVVQLDPPDDAGVWLVTVRARGAKDELIPMAVALRNERGSRPIAGEWARLERILPALGRSGVQRRGQVAVSQDEAWLLMTRIGPTLSAAGFEVRVPPLSRHKPAPRLRLFAEPREGSPPGAQQVSDVTWSVLFEDLELGLDDITRLLRQGRPLLQPNGLWAEVARSDLDAAGIALSARTKTTSLTGAEILRYTIGLDGSGLRGGVLVEGDSWANEIIRYAQAASTAPITQPDEFVGELRTYQAEALAWIGFLDEAGLGGCLALDMGLGKTPTVLAHLLRTAGKEPALVIAPAAVVGNWAAEAHRFTPALRCVVHHGASRSEDEELTAEIENADVVITTYATAVRDIDELSRVRWGRIILDEAQGIKNAASETAQQLRRLDAHIRLALTGTPIENGLGDLWAILDFTNLGLVGSRSAFMNQMSGDGEAALRALNGILLFRRTKSEPEVAAELPDKIDELDHCTMTAEQIEMYQKVLDDLVVEMAAATRESADGDVTVQRERKQGAILAAITALKQICNHPAAYRDDGRPLAGRSGKLARLEELVHTVFAAGERVLVFTHFATWGRRLAAHLTEVTGMPISCYDGSLARGARDRLVAEFQSGTGAGALVLSLKAGGTGLNLTSANHVVLYDRWWNPAVEDQARDRAWRIGQEKTVISHRLVCPGTVDDRVEEVVEGKRYIANLVLPRSSSLADLDGEQLRAALGLRDDELITEDD